MNTIKHYYRLLDVVVQVVLLTAWVVSAFADRRLMAIFYYIISGWFFISLIIHTFISTAKYKEVYTKPAVIIISALGAFAIGLICPALLYLEVYFVVASKPILAFILPLVSIFYTYKCVGEIFYLRKRPMAYLK
ncbi:MAG TPA: hypothetical protein VG738_16345 [Chitinophagaceae bacterium]|nr:hypothetical protein [Chitinophagaceae bacterium]